MPPKPLERPSPSLRPTVGGAQFFREAARRSEEWRARTRFSAMNGNNQQDQAVGSQPSEQGGRARRTNPRRVTRRLAADIITPAGETLHVVSRDVSAFGASFFVTENAEALPSISVGDVVFVNTSTARDLRAEINSIRPFGEGDDRPLVGLKLLDGKLWLGGAEAGVEELIAAELVG
jgi:hypothetical protein